MTKVYTGRDGTLSIGNDDPIAKVVSFSVQSNLETLETTTLGENERSYTPGVLGYSGTATLLYYEFKKGTETRMNTTDILNKSFTTNADGVTASGGLVDLRLNWLNGSRKRTIEVNAYITSASIGAVTGDIVRAEISFQGTGRLKGSTISAV